MTPRTRRICEKGQASIEMALVAPLFAMIVWGVGVLSQMAYARLALITAVSDCAMIGAQGRQNSGHASAALEAVMAAYGVDAETQTVIVPRGGARVTCEAGHVDGPPVNQLYSLTFTLPRQPYKSLWPDGGP
jgi:Flp pilus assembly protein TadG